jgi:hypothetical protein
MRAQGLERTEGRLAFVGSMGTIGGTLGLELEGG